MSAERPMSIATLILVKPSGTVDVLLRAPVSPEAAGSAFTSRTLSEFLAQPGCVVPEDAPIARLDVLARGLAEEFVTNGPIPATHLPVGTVRSIDGTEFTFSGQPWHVLGASTLVSVDVYLSLVCQIGAIVHSTRDCPDVPEARPAEEVVLGVAAFTIDSHTPEGAAIVDLFLRIKSVEAGDAEGSWPGADVVDQLSRWFLTVGIDPEEEADQLLARLRGNSSRPGTEYVMTGTSTRGFQVRIFLNTSRDAHDGYEAGHAVVEVASYVTAAIDENTALDEAYQLCNIGDDPAFGTPDPRAVIYRKRRNRSLSIGDVVSVGDTFHACAPTGWTRLSTTPSVTWELQHGITPLDMKVPESADEISLVRLPFGYNDGLPPATSTAWGCRAIVDNAGHVDVPHDRQSGEGPRIIELLAHLNDHVRGAWSERAAGLLRAGKIRTTAVADVVLYRDDKVIVRGNCQASGGYLYVCAYFHGEDQ